MKIKTNTGNRINIDKSIRYDFIVLITGKKRRTIITYFNNNKLDILNNRDVMKYIRKYIDFKKFINVDNV